ncbi:DUF969 domain-containing protein [Fusobacterium sp.]|uniref:DUF969 domain-containing protein n=1 Tax=Fusobacterium sp. TaxID=68766 RepID=UPI0025C4E317|nr:DUF969 domain-containing protein [Fusobacterium sp.]
MIKLIGILLIIIGFSLKLDTIMVVLLAGIATGLVSSIDFLEILSILGNAFISTRYMTILLLTLATVGLLERNGLRERAAKCIAMLQGATCGKVLTVYVIIRTIAAALSLRLGGHVQFIRPLVYPMAKGAAERNGALNKELDEELKSLANSMENYGNFYGQNVFIASSGVLLIMGTLKELGINGLEAYNIAKANFPMAVIAIILAGIRNYMFDKKISKKQVSSNE